VTKAGAGERWATRTDGEAEVLRTEREPEGPVHGRYQVRFSDGRTVTNYPGYLLVERIADA
jgi:hypothetical protein